MLKTLEKHFTTLCQPDPKSYPDPQGSAALFVQNKSLLTFHISLVFIDLLSLPFSDLANLGNQFRLLTTWSMLAVFLLFCRSNALICQIFNTFMLNTLGLILHFKEDAIYMNIPVSYAAPLMVFSSTRKIRLAGLTSLIQLTTVLMIFKKNLVEGISFSDPMIFAENFSRSFVTVSVPVQILILIQGYDLNTKAKQISRAYKKVEEALEQQKIFVYSFSHEMRNPMNSLLGNLDLALMSNGITPELKEMIGTAKVCGVLLLNLINTVLDAGKLGLGKLEVNPVPARVHDVFQRVWAISHDIMTRKGLKSHLKMSKTVPPRLMLDSHRLNQVLMNLIGNAVKFTENGSITLSVSWLDSSCVSDESFKPVPYDDESEGVFEKDYNLYALRRRHMEEVDQSMILSGAMKEFNLAGVSHPSVESKGVIKIILKDSGCGINPEELTKLFQKFSQVGHVTSKRQMGTGLGLFISKEIVENMGGQIRVYSKPSVGSTFIVCIPTTALPIKSQSENQISINDYLIPKLKARKFTSMIADDSSFNVSLVSNFYTKVGVEVLATANNGKTAYEKYLELVRSKHFIDIVTLDIDMPIMDGKQVCEKIRQYERENNLKRSIIILISGNYEEEDMHNLLLSNKGEGNGPDCFLKKPLVFEELCWTLYKYV